MTTAILSTGEIVDRLKYEYNSAKYEGVLDRLDTVELTGVQFEVDRDWLLREPNQDYIARELQWYESMSRNVYDIPGDTPAIWRDVANVHGHINSNYGWCIYSPDNGYQFGSVADELRDNEKSRRAVMYYTRPSMHVDQYLGGMNDHMCTTHVQYFIRRGKLDAHVYMRSNDAVFGYNNDVAWQKHVHGNLHARLLRTYPNLELGSMTWNVGSLHVYPRHYNLLENNTDA